MISRGRQSKQAMAIVITMLIVLLLVMLTGALIKTQSGAFALMKVSDRERDSRVACRSLYDFCVYQLEYNREWGRGGFLDDAEVLNPRSVNNGLVSMSSRVDITSVEGTTFKGKLTDESLDFEIEVLNALTSGGGTATSQGVPVKAEQVVLHISVGEQRDGEFLPIQKATTVLQLAPLFDGTVLSRGDVEIDSREVFFASKDPRRNEMRTDGSADFPGLTRGGTKFLDFHPGLLDDDPGLTGPSAGAGRFDSKGLLYAGGEIKESGATLDAAEISKAAQESGGRIVSMGEKRVDIYDLTAANIPQPKPGDLRHDIIVPPGEFRFDSIEATITIEEPGQGRDETPKIVVKTQTIDVCSYYDPPGSPKPHKIMRGEVDKTSYAGNAKILDVDITFPGDVESVPVDIGNKFYLNNDFQENHYDPNTQETTPELGIRSDKNGGSGPIEIDLNSHILSVAPKTRVRPQSRPSGSNLPPSSFQITVDKGKRPTFILGTAANDVILEADGDVEVGKGTTDGLGTVISKQGSVTLEPNPNPFEWEYVPGEDGEIGEYVLKKNTIDVNNSSNYDGLVVFAEKDVNITNPGNVDWNFRGFVYANGSFNFDVGNQKALFFGSVVARGKNQDGGPASLKIRNSSKLGFVYDPEYLKTLTRKLPNNWTRLESVVWNSSAGS